MSICVTLNCLITGVLGSVSVCVCLGGMFFFVSVCLGCVEGDRRGGRGDEENSRASHQQALNGPTTKPPPTPPTHPTNTPTPTHTSTLRHPHLFALW